MAIQFHLIATPDGSRRAVIHGVTLSSYPARRFSVWLDESGHLTDSESRMAERQAGWRGVKRDSKQWRELARWSRMLWADCVANDPEYRAARAALRFLKSLAGV